MAKFESILERALFRKGGERGLEAMIYEPLPKAHFLSQSDIHDDQGGVSSRLCVARD